MKNDLVLAFLNAELRDIRETVDFLLNSLNTN